MSNTNTIPASAAAETILGLLDRRALNDPDGLALRCHDNSGTKETNWRELAARVRLLAAGWRALGVKEGEPVAILMPNSPDLLAAQLSVIAAGGAAAAMDPAHLVRTMRQSFGLLPLRFCLIGNGDQLTSVEFSGLSGLQCLVHQAPLPRVPGCPAVTLGRLEEMGRQAAGELPVTDPAKTCAAAFTMGCSGFPVPAALSQAALLASGRGLAEALGLGAGAPYLSLSHLSSSWTLQEFLACAHSGAQLSVMSWCPGMRALEKTAARLSPAFIRISHAAFMEMFAPYLRAGKFAARRAPLSLRVKAAASRLWGGRWNGIRDGALPILRRALFPGLRLGTRAPKIILSCGTLSQRALDVMKGLGQPVLHTYGLTEACGFVTVGRGGTRTQGRPIAGMSLSLGDAGDIRVHGPALMSGYLGLPPGKAGPRCVVHGGELFTRDFGRLEPGGELCYERSARYQYRSEGGETVSCDRVAEILMEDPLLLRAAVVGGVKNGLNLKSVVAIVAPDPDALNKFFGPVKGYWLPRERRERLEARLRARMNALPPEQRPHLFLFSSPYSSAAWMGKLCPDRRLRYAMIQPRDNFDLLYLQLRDTPKPQPEAGAAQGRRGEPIFLSIESEFDRPLMRHEITNRDFGFKADKVLGGGIATLLGALEHAGWDPDYLPYRFQWNRAVEPQIEKLADFISRRPGRIITAGSASVALPFLLSALKIVCARDPGRRVVLGGCGPSAAAGSVIANYPFVDAVILGEAEASLPRVLEALTAGGDLSALPGIVTRAPDGTVLAGVPERIRDLDAMPAPSYGRVDLRLYHHVSVPTMRGCPNKCKFCGNRAMYGPGVSLRSLDLVMAELRMLHNEKGQNDFFISDDTFTLLKPRVLDFCARMKSEFGGKVNWFCYASVDSLDAERMKAMAEAGCRCVFIGVESGSDRLLRNFKGAGGYTVAQAMVKMKEASAYFPSVQAGLIIGFPDESLFDFIQTLRVGREIMQRGYGDVVFHWLKAIPLTPLFEQNRASLQIPPKISLYKGNKEYSQWAKTIARIDPSLAPWAVQIPTPHPRIKEFLLRRFMKDFWNL